MPTSRDAAVHRRTAGHLRLASLSCAGALVLAGALAWQVRRSARSGWEHQVERVRLQGTSVMVFAPGSLQWLRTHNPRLPPYAVRSNSLGFRTRYEPGPPTAGTTRAVLLGDSFLFGWGLAEEDTFAAHLEKELAARGARAEVVNLALPGQNHQSMLETLEAVGLRYHPSVVLMGCNADDILPDWNHVNSGDLPALPPGLEGLGDARTHEREKARVMGRLVGERPGSLAEVGLEPLWEPFVVSPVTRAVELGTHHSFGLGLLLVATGGDLDFRYRALAEGRGIPLLALRRDCPLPAGDWAIPGDGHPTTAATRCHAFLAAKWFTALAPARDGP